MITTSDSFFKGYLKEFFPQKRFFNSLKCSIEESFCFSVADFFDNEPVRTTFQEVTDSYRYFKMETLDQLKFLLKKTIKIKPWKEEGQPYKNHSDLIKKFNESGILYFYLTKSGYGSGNNYDNHPMLEETNIRIENEVLLYNDAFRIVHDFFGHILLEHDFQIHGEFKAAYTHMTMYSALAQPAVFSETIGQICWFFYGPHLRNPNGKLFERGEAGYQHPKSRPYSEQKPIIFPSYYIGKFKSQFKEL